MENILKNIKEHKLVKPGQVVAVATSGGSDSMALLHFLNAHKTELDIDICAVHIDHSLRENSAEDANFVMTYCKSHGIRAYKFKIDVNKLANQKNLSVETAAREARYGVLKRYLKKMLQTKLPLHTIKMTKPKQSYKTFLGVQACKVPRVWTLSVKAFIFALCLQPPKKQSLTISL